MENSILPPIVCGRAQKEPALEWRSKVRRGHCRTDLQYAKSTPHNPWFSPWLPIPHAMRTRRCTYPPFPTSSWGPRGNVTKLAMLV
eukprot:8469748-Pyramimonas_sp.AAC.2